MNDVPLVNTNNIHDINTSIIAIKKQLKQLNEAVGLIDMPTIDTSVFVKKSEVVDVVEEGNMSPVTSNAVVPVDEVTSGNMHSVTSNAVANNCVPKNNTVLNGNLDINYGFADFDLVTLTNKFCNVYVVGNANRRYLGKFYIAEYLGGYSVVVYYAPSLSISIVDNKVRVLSNDSCYDAKLTYFDNWNVERILQ